MKSVTPVQFEVPLDFIIISYCPGSFGSILYHSLNTAPELGAVHPTDMFQAQDGSATNGGAHNVNCEIFDRQYQYPVGPFHDGEEVDPWISGSDQYRRQYILDNINTDKALRLKSINPQRRYFLHRWVVPRAEYLLPQYLQCKIVGVVLEDDIDFAITVDMHVKKSLGINQTTNIIPKLQKNNPLAHRVYQRLNDDQKHSYLYRISQQRITDINQNRAYDIGIRLKQFLDHDAYLQRITDIAGFLNIHPDYQQVSSIYKNFHTINHINRIRHEYSI